MSKAVTAIVKAIFDEKDIGILKNFVRSQIKEEMKEIKETLGQTSKCVKELREIMMLVVKKNDMDSFKLLMLLLAQYISICKMVI